MKRMLRVYGLAMLMLLWASAASSQIISTSLPAATADGGEKKVAYHVMAGFANWSFKILEYIEDGSADVSEPSGGAIIAGDVTIQASETVSVGIGAFYNKSGSFEISDEEFGTDVFEIDMVSLYGNAYWSGWQETFAIGAQVGLIRAQEEVSNADFPELDGSATYTDLNFFLVARVGVARWSAGAGVGGYRYAGDDEFDYDAETVPSIFVNGSVKVAKGLSVDAGYWYIGETSGGDDSASRLSIGVGFTF